ncbi:hypothetical protein B0H16DRAFT_732523 [Mycena metata]|uniref:NACHT domain-containing protein n=1 Tax=Mycena metata TaxID=1033252 RepID=A0AAD7J622_9AGAR|nr:hypothetical protein B0H16DRAFT_732523 [Mycena metata]
MAEILGVVTGALQLVETALKARDYVKDFRNAPAEQQKLFSEMTTLKSLLEEFQKRVGASDVTGTLQHMVVPLARFTTVMEKFTVKFGVADGRWSQLSKRLTWTLWNKTEAKEYIVEFESIKSLLNAWLAVGIWDAGQEHKKDHAAILSAVDNNAREQQDHNNAGKKKQIMDWITSLNFFQRQADIFSLWQPGTGQWLLSNPKFYKWESVPGQILWCRGIPGAGKTILSSLVIHHLRDQFRDGNIGVACIYLDHKETEAQTPVNLLAGLWKQLVVDKPLTIAVQELYRHHQQRDTSPVIDEVFSILQAAVAERSGVYFVIDALDEYPEHQRNILLRYLSRLQAPTISFLITSRPHVTLAPFFTEPQTLEILATGGRYWSICG